MLSHQVFSIIPLVFIAGSSATVVQNFQRPVEWQGINALRYYCSLDAEVIPVQALIYHDDVEGYISTGKDVDKVLPKGQLVPVTRPLSYGFYQTRVAMSGSVPVEILWTFRSGLQQGDKDIVTLLKIWTKFMPNVSDLYPHFPGAILTLIRDATKSTTGEQSS